MNRIVLFSILYSWFGVISCFSQNPIVQNYELNVENDAVHQYLNEVVYEPNDASVIDDYRDFTGYRKDWPKPLTITLPETTADSVIIECWDQETLQDSLIFKVENTKEPVDLYNFIPNRTYDYIIKDETDILQQGEIVTTGQLRMLNIPGEVNNIRDMGGWKTADNMRIRYGKLFRGSELNGSHFATEEGINLLRQLGVGAELDLRAFYNKDNNISAFGFTDQSHTPSGEVATYYYTYDSGQLLEHMSSSGWQYKWRMEFRFIVNNLRQNRAIYEHCVQGKDRAGFLAFLLEGLLGVPYNGLVRDYELTFFAINMASTKATIDEIFDYIEGQDGETLRDKFNSYFTKKLSVSQSDIDYFRSVMLEEIDDSEKEEIVTVINSQKSHTRCTNNHVFYNLSGQRVSVLRSQSFYLIKDGQNTMKVFIR